MDVVHGDAAERRVRLLQSEINAIDQISTLKQRVDLMFLRLEQQSLSDLRALAGQEMLAIRKLEDRMESQDLTQTVEKPAKVLVFVENPVLKRLESEITELGSLKLVNDKDVDTDTLYAGTTTHKSSAASEKSVSTYKEKRSTFSGTPASSQQAKLRRTQSERFAPSTCSSFVKISGTQGPYITGQESETSSYCFVETGTLSRRYKQRISVMDSFDESDGRQKDSISPMRTSDEQQTLPGSATEQDIGDMLFIILKDNTIVTASKSSGAVTLHNPGFVFLSTVKISSPSAICHHVAYDVIAIVSREDDKDFVVLLKANNGHLQKVDKLSIQCQGQVSCMAFSASKLYLGCSGNHIHVFDENWKQKPTLAYAPIGYPLISIACNDAMFCLVGSDGCVTYVDSLGRYQSKDKISALKVGLIGGKPFVLCKDNGVKVVETSPREDEMTATVVIKTGLRDALDMHVSAESGDVDILFWKGGNLDIRKFKPYH